MCSTVNVCCLMRGKNANFSLRIEMRTKLEWKMENLLLKCRRGRPMERNQEQNQKCIFD